MKKSIKKSYKTIIRLILILEIMLVAILGIINFTTKKEKESKLTQEERQSMQYDEVTNNDANIDGTDYVQFSAFFLRDLDNDGYAEKYNGTCKNVDEKDNLYISLNVLTNGYLKDGKIEIKGTNFSLTTKIPKDNQIKNNVIGNNIRLIELNQINNGTVKTIIGTIKSTIGNNINNYSRNDNKVILTGTHVSDEGVETPIRKEVNLTADWYGDISTYIYKDNNLKSLDSLINEKNKTFTVSAEVGIQEGEDELLISKSHIEGIVPLFNNYEPIKVEINGTQQTSFNYDEETRIFTAEKIAEVDENGEITEKGYTGTKYDFRINELKRINTININIVYPLEAYETVGGDTVEIIIPVKGWFEGFNNPNDEFENPKRAETRYINLLLSYSRPRGYIAYFETEIGEQVNIPEYRHVVSNEKPKKSIIIYQVKKTKIII